MTAVRLGAVLLSAIVLQATLVADVRFVDVSVDLLLVIAIAAGLTGGPDRGAVIGFVAGLGMDLLLDTPFGLSALAYSLTGYLVGGLRDIVDHAAWWFPIPVAFGAGGLGLGIYVVGGDLAGEELSSAPGLWTIVAVVAVACAVLILPANRLLRWCYAGPDDARVAVL
jgi:rod shape-determining protein MreD